MITFKFETALQTFKNALLNINWEGGRIIEKISVKKGVYISIKSEQLSPTLEVFLIAE